GRAGRAGGPVIPAAAEEKGRHETDDEQNRKITFHGAPPETRSQNDCCRTAKPCTADIPSKEYAKCCFTGYPDYV
ncbi:MAG: hypothetical protein MIO92_02435, partial [Methanosarcinaceae archaeon]|nr:hypothetical protein [Methanosarcinaceae archaeon]